MKPRAAFYHNGNKKSHGSNTDETRIKNRSKLKTWRGVRPQPKLSHGSNAGETWIKNEKIQQKQPEKARRMAILLFLCYLLFVRPSFEIFVHFVLFVALILGRRNNEFSHKEHEEHKGKW
jgi:hypothetical protein